MVYKVTCAIIKHEEKTLVVQRSERMSQSLKWEFPGGKIEANETAEECIIREIMEELNIEIKLLKPLTPSFFKYPNIAIELIPFLADYQCGELKLKEHKQFVFLKNEELISLDWAEADIPIVKEYLSL